MTGPCGAQTRDVHGNVVCDLESNHRGDHSGEVVGGVRLRWSAAPPLSPREREIVDRFENAPNGLYDHEPYTAGRGDYGCHYASGVVELVEKHNCSKGCTVPDPKDVAEFGPGGTCGLLALLFTGDPIPEFEALPTHVVCHARTTEIPGQTDLLGGA